MSTNRIAPAETAQLVDRFVRRIHAELSERAPAVDTDRVGPWGGMALMALADAGPLPILDLAARMARDKSQTTRKIKEMEAKGLIARQTARHDARVSVIGLTPKGERLVAQLKQVLGGVLDDLLAPLAPAERAQFHALLEKL